MQLHRVHRELSELIIELIIFSLDQAAYWYNSDMFEASKIFDFGFKKRQQQPVEAESEGDSSSEEIEDDKSDHSLEDCFHMVSF